MTSTQIETHINVCYRDFLDNNQTRHLDEVVRKILSHYRLTMNSKQVLLVSYKDWRSAGGMACALPTNVRIVHGLSKPELTSPNHFLKDQRKSLVSDQVQGDVTRVHLSALRATSDGVKASPVSAYCGQFGDGSRISANVCDVTCPECLLELSEVNTAN